MLKKFIVGDLLYHSIHGLCCVNQVLLSKESGKEVLRYSLVPKAANPMKLRYVISAEDLVKSGFHELVTPNEANRILDYLKTTFHSERSSHPGPRTVSSTFAEDNQTWALAKMILSCSQDDQEAKEQKKRQILERSARGLIYELAFVLKISLEETVGKVLKNLQHTSKINPIVLAAIQNTLQD